MMHVSNPAFEHAGHCASRPFQWNQQVAEQGLEYQDTVDQINRQIFDLTLRHDGVPLMQGSTMWGHRGGHNASVPTSIPASIPLPDIPTTPPPSYPPDTSNRVECKSYEDLYLWDVEIALRIEAVAKMFKQGIATAVGSTESQHAINSLSAQLQWFRTTYHFLSITQPSSSDDSATVLKSAMLETLLTEISHIEKCVWRLEGSSVSKTSIAATYDTAKHFHHPFQTTSPLLLVAIFIALVLNILGHVSRPSCNLVLRMLKILLQSIFEEKGGPTQAESRILLNFPRDIRSVRKAFTSSQP
ncbi:hypothetical protein A0H81_14169 [Grifola frondosa]|uniref:Uncharacterized protein n=1 Tax=Grifola frondosa TaxID=5627 RepID=A0A1C7LNP7_GRIFR|nr:hypothetical protein A0H81_14169 [Grifola frondosa]